MSQPHPCSSSSSSSDRNCSQLCLMTGNESSVSSAGWTKRKLPYSVVMREELPPHHPTSLRTPSARPVTRVATPRYTHRPNTVLHHDAVNTNSNNVYHDAYREQSASSYRVNSLVSSGRDRGGGSRDRSSGMYSTTKGVGVVTSSVGSSSGGGGGRVEYVLSVAEGMCGCVRGMVLSPNNWQCEPCRSHHFFCNSSQPTCIQQHDRSVARSFMCFISV